MQSSHNLNRIKIAFDDKNLVTNAGHLLVATLAEGLGLRGLLDERVCLGAAPGRANVGLKAMTIIHSVLSGGDCIDDVDRLRAGSTQAVLCQEVRASSTLGTFLRSFTWGHAKQLDAVSGELLKRAWASGAGPEDDPFTIDIDSTICETYGLAKAGASKFTYTHVRGYHPLIAVASGTGDVLNTRLRGGPANVARGAASFVVETIGRTRKAGATGSIALRADAGFYNHKVVGACRKNNVNFSITAKLTASLHKIIESIPDEQWTPIPYWMEGAGVAEVFYAPFGKHGFPMRLIVRRVPPNPGSQLALFSKYGYHAFITDRVGDTLALEADHRRHAEIENTIRDLKYGVGLNHMPSGKFAANAAWLTLNVIAHNLARWISRLGFNEKLVATKTLRQRALSLPGRIARRSRMLYLHLPSCWPWAKDFEAALVRLRAISPPLVA
jgi:hypothetical protein